VILDCQHDENEDSEAAVSSSSELIIKPPSPAKTSRRRFGFSSAAIMPDGPPASNVHTDFSHGPDGALQQ